MDVWRPPETPGDLFARHRKSSTTTRGRRASFGPGEDGNGSQRARLPPSEYGLSTALIHASLYSLNLGLSRPSAVLALSALFALSDFARPVVWPYLAKMVANLLQFLIEPLNMLGQFVNHPGKLVPRFAMLGSRMSMFVVGMSVMLVFGLARVKAWPGNVVAQQLAKVIRFLFKARLEQVVDRFR